MPRDAEAWLAERGVERDPIRLTPSADEVTRVEAEARAATDDASGASGASGATGAGPSGDDPHETAPSVAPERRAGDEPAPPDGGPTGGHGPPPSAREVTQLAAASASAVADDAAHRGAQRPVGGPTLSDDVATALAFIRRSTATAPQSVGRLRDKLAGRGAPQKVIELALDRAHAEGLVDDDAMAAALVAEGRAKGHAPTRLRADLTRRGFAREVIERAVSVTAGEDLEAVAFAIARERAGRLTGVPSETAVRRIVGQLARRGYPEGLARKVAREAVFTSRDPARTAGH